ncbi:Pentatricopeptide repeat (PPR) superfamily protein [Euphorbia peplus]|nr:Pentatricopeptide repeat (PPR) superfamily protein [Euphorbia peplus]
MLLRRFSSYKPLLNPLFRHRLLTTSDHRQPPSPINPDHLLRVCTILYQQQNSPDSNLHSKLSSFDPQITHEFFLQVCNKFPASWRPVYRLFNYTNQTPKPHFTHTSTSFNKLLNVISKSRNIDLFWATLQQMGEIRLVNDKTFILGLNTLASARELKKCVEFFHVMNGYGYEYSVERLNKVVESLCKGNKLVDEAKFVVWRLKEWIMPNGVTYGLLVKGFCDVGNMVDASKVWNLMVDEGFEPGIDVFEKMMETFFKRNEYDEALKVFHTMRVNRMDDLGVSTYRLVINWMCKKWKIAQAKMVFDEMLERNIEVDNLTLGYLLYGLLARGRVNEAYRVMEGIKNPDISVYHGLIKGLIKLRKTSEATQVFREMIKRGCEPIMHTYIMLLQGHLGKRGRKGENPIVNFDSIFVGGLVKAGRSLDASKYVERSIKGGVEVDRFDYNKFLHFYSSEEGVVMFEQIGQKLREAGMVDLADILQRYGEKMATRDRRRNRTADP